MHQTFLAFPLGTRLMLTCSHLVFPFTDKETGVEGKTALREATLPGMAHPAVPPCTLPVLLAD